MQIAQVQGNTELLLFKNMYLLVLHVLSHTHMHYTMYMGH